MAAYNIYIDGGFITITDVPVTLNHLKNGRSDTTFEFDEPTGTFKFFWNTYEPQQSSDRRIIGDVESYLYSDLTAVIETIAGVPTIIPIANARALESYLNNKIVFFFNPDPVDVEVTSLPAITFADSPSLDAFGKLRVSQVISQGDIKQIHDNLPLFLNSVTNGSATITHSAVDAKSTIVTSAIGDYAIAQTKQRFNYRTGKSQEIYQTMYDIDSELNITKRLGYFSSSIVAPYNTDLDGFWLEASGGTHYIVTSKTGTETSRVARSDWYDPMDGTGVSGVDLGDLDVNMIVQPDFEWLGVGRVRYVLVCGGIKYLIHAVDFTNGSRRWSSGGWVVIDAAFKGVYMSSPNQPLRSEVRQDGVGSSSTTFICGTVGTEGALNNLGKNTGYDDDGTHLNANSTGSWYYAIGIRLQAARVDTLVDIINGYLLSDTADKFLYRVLFNPTYNGTVTYVDITDSSLSFGLGALTNTIITDGYIMDIGSGAENSVQGFDFDNAIRLGANIDGTLDEIVVVVKPLSSNLDIHRGLTSRELS